MVIDNNTTEIRYIRNIVYLSILHEDLCIFMNSCAGESFLLDVLA